jgi:hypothetical protein
VWVWQKSACRSVSRANPISSLHSIHTFPDLTVSTPNLHPNPNLNLPEHLLCLNRSRLHTTPAGCAPVGDVEPLGEDVFSPPARAIPPFQSALRASPPRLPSALSRAIWNYCSNYYPLLKRNKSE